MNSLLLIGQTLWPDVLALSVLATIAIVVRRQHRPTSATAAATTQNRSSIAGVVTVATFLLLVAGLSAQGVLTAPPRVESDALEYDSIALEVASGNGFAIDFTNPALRATYPGHEDILDRERGPSVGHHGPMTYRAPLWPAVMAGSYSVLGREFWPLRLLNAFLLSIVAGAAAMWSVRVTGQRWLVIFPVVSMALLDTRIQQSAGELLTESISIFLAFLVCWCLARTAVSGRTSDAVVAGVCLGLAVLARMQFALWTPVLCLGLCIAALSKTRFPWWSPRTWRPGLVVGVVTLAIAAPWFIRNCVQLKALQPLGLQGSMELSAGWSEHAWRTKGVWTNRHLAGDYDSIAGPEVTGIEREKAIARVSSAAAKEWVFANPVRALLLTPFKIIQEFAPRRPGQLLLLCLAGIGLWRLRGTAEGWIFLSLLGACLLTVAATWSVGGRFVYPLLAPMHIAAAVGLAAVVAPRNKANEASPTTVASSKRLAA